MRVLVATDQIGALSTLEAGSALASAWADQDAQVAVAALGPSGGGFVRAMADAERADVDMLPGEDSTVALRVVAGDVAAIGLEGGADAPDEPATWRQASSAPLGAAVADLLRTHRPRRLFIDLAWAGRAHDAGAGFLAGLSAEPGNRLRGGLAAVRELSGPVDLGAARELVRDVELVGVVPAAEVGRPLLGLRGISAVRGTRAGVDLETTLAVDAALERFCASVAPDAAGAPSAGACGGAGFAIAALGGTLVEGVAACADRVTLARTIAQADLVVTGCDRFDFFTRGGDVVAYLSERCSAAGVPLIVVANELMIGRREMRTFGIEDAYALELGDPTRDSVRDASAAIARSWSW